MALVKPALIALLMSMIWIVIFKFSKISSVASLISLFLSIVTLIVIGTNYVNSIFLALILILIVYKHKDNIIRLYRGEESKISL